MRVLDAHSPGPIRLRQSGVALAILVWFLAAMSILVAGIVYQARMDIKLAQLQIGQARAQAAGDGAIQLALADLIISEQDGEFNSRRIHSSEFVFSDARVNVRIVPVAGLVNLNLASQELLAVLFTDDGELDEGRGEVLAANVVEWRSSPARDNATGTAYEGQSESGNATPGPFEAIEGLLSVDGVDRGVYERVRDSIYVDPQGQAGVDWQSAPVAVLAMLNSGGDIGVQDLARSRFADTSVDAVSPAGVNMSFQEERSLSLFRIDALVKIGEANYRRRRWVDRSQVGADGLPWRFFRTEPVAGLNKKEREMLVFVESIYAGN